MLIDTPLLVVGRGPAALVVAKVAAGYGLACLLVGHEAIGDAEAVPVGPDAFAALERHGVLDILRPYLAALDPPSISPLTFEDVVKHHCVADLNVTVYDQMDVVERVPAGRGLRAVLTDGRSKWDLSADMFIDATLLPSALSAAIVDGAAAAFAAANDQRSSDPGDGHQSTRDSRSSAK
jgi:hypothetical protein